MVAPVTAPYAPNYAFSVPYLTPAEYLAEPTGVDVSQLIPGIVSPAAQTAALTRVIGRASSWADQYCRKILAATVDVQSGEYRLRADGTIRVPLDNTPIVQVTNVNIGQVAGQLQPLASLAGIRFRKKTISIPVAGAAAGWPPAPMDFGATARYGFYFADVTYINGFAHTLTASASAAGAASIQVSPTVAGTGVGIVPGLPLTIYDGAASGANTETVIVGAGYVFGSATVPLAAPALYAHGAGCSVSALPGFARQAVIGFTSALIKTRGSDALVMPAGPGGHSFKEEDLMPGASEDVNIAMELLEPLRRVW